MFIIKRLVFYKLSSFLCKNSQHYQKPSYMNIQITLIVYFRDALKLLFNVVKFSFFLLQHSHISTENDSQNSPENEWIYLILNSCLIFLQKLLQIFCYCFLRGPFFFRFRIFRFTAGNKIIRALEMIRIKKLIPNAVL